MNPAARAAIVAALVRKLRAADSWTGETHVQKTAYFLQDLLEVPLGFRFTLYKFGPFSFDLRDQLTEMRSLGQLELEPRRYPYGPKLAVSAGADQLNTRFPKTLRRHNDAIDFVVDHLADHGVSSLERLATALLVTDELGWEASTDDRARRLHEYKPHVELRSAEDAVAAVDRLRAQAHELSAS